MFDLTEEDYELIEAARDAIRRNYDGEKYNHTVGAAVRCGLRRRRVSRCRLRRAERQAASLRFQRLRTVRADAASRRGRA